MKPREITLRWSWSNSGLYGGYGTAMQDIYQMLAVIQTQRQPLNIFTGKAAYQSMLIASLGVTTNEGSEYAVQAIMVCREVIIVTTQTLQPGQAAQAVPQSTSVITNQGNVTPTQVSPARHCRASRRPAGAWAMSTVLSDPAHCLATDVHHHASRRHLHDDAHVPLGIWRCGRRASWCRSGRSDGYHRY